MHKPGNLESAPMLRERYMYLRGLADAAPKTSTEPRDQLLRQVVELLGEVVERLCELEQRVGVGRRASREVMKEHRSGPDSGTITCPICGEQLVVGSAVAEGRRVEITCPNCGTELEVEP